jgi:hypothetical protein
MSLAVMITAMASANSLMRWAVLRSVLRRSCPKFESHELVRSTGQRRPRSLRVRFFLVLRGFFGQMTSSIPAAAPAART